MTDVPWTGTGGPSDTNSYAFLVLNAIYNRLSSSSLFQGFTVKRITNALPLEASYQLPFLGIYLGDEIANEPTNRESRIGDIKFNHSVPICFQIVVKDNDSVAMQQKLNQATWFVINQVFRDNTLTNFYRTGITGNVNDPMQIYFSRYRVPKPIWGRESKNETPLGMQLIEFTIQFETEFAPTNFDDLKEISVTAYPELAPPKTTATGTGTGAGVNLTMTGVAGTIEPNATITGNGVPAGATIVSQQSGTTGGDGVYTTSIATTAAASSLTFENPVAIMEVDVVYRFDPDYVPPPLTGAGP